MTVIIDEDRTTQFLIRKSNETFRFLDDVDIQVENQDGILERKGEKKNQIEWNGLVEVQGTGFAGIHATGFKTKVLVGEEATFAGDIGILHTGDQARILYSGDGMEALTAGIRTTGADARINVQQGAGLTSDGVGIDMRGGSGTSQLINGGAVNGAVGVHIEGSAVITNTGVITGAGLGIEIDSGAKQPSLLTNSGIVNSGGATGVAVRMGAGGDEISNTGIFIGKVMLGGGNDRYESVGIEGLVVGGKGNDRFITNGATEILEAAGGGFDEVRSSSSISLAAFVEKLTLTGSSDINGTGTSDDNTLIGNSGKNTLSGEQGNDSLTGKGDIDVFRFSDDFDKDAVKDFKPNVDKIDIAGWTAIESFDDLIDNHLKIDGKDLIFKADGDSLTLKNVKLGQIDEADFMI